MTAVSKPHKGDSSDALMCVEFGPGDARDYVGLTYLEGCVGEVLESEYRRALSERTSRKKILTRFPLVGFNSYNSMYPPKGLEKLTICEDGILIHVDDLHPVSKRPVSFYERIPLTWELLQQEDAFGSLFEAPHYLSTFSKAKALTLIEALGRTYDHCWLWKSETNKEKDNLFLEARVYGIDTVIGVYDRKRFNGVALEVLTRQASVPRCRSDLYLFSNQQEYVDYLDGVQINRARIRHSEITPIYAAAIKAKEARLSQLRVEKTEKKSAARS